ncbi:MAG: hypothetical protein R2706_10750 [Acidimicrobiales bacterium]
MPSDRQQLVIAWSRRSEQGNAVSMVESARLPLPSWPALVAVAGFGVDAPVSVVVDDEALDDEPCRMSGARRRRQVVGTVLDDLPRASFL